VKELLDEPNDSSSFTRSGFSPGRLGYTTPSVCPLFRSARTLGAAKSTVATGISITSPPSGTTTTSCEPIVVEVAGSADVATVLLPRRRWRSPGTTRTAWREPCRFTLASAWPSRPGARRRTGGGVILNGALDDVLTVTFDGVDSAPIPIRALVPDDLGPCGTETTTTTTGPPSTTITLPSCQADTDCDDGDACTGDVCAPAGCEHVAAAGPDGAECLLSAALAEPLCPAGTIAARLEQFATTKLERALRLMQKADLTAKPKRQQRFLNKASKALGKIGRHRPGATSDDCLQRLTALVDNLLGTLLEPPPITPPPA
jgi:hypothetical protein